ncbi:MAG: hypothetical protein ACLPH3_01505 [Terracidiphilus sp.]
MFRTTLACTIGLFAICSADAQPAQGVSGDLKNFVTQFVAATNAKDIVRQRSFLYPKSLACVTPENKDYYDAMASHIGEPIPPNYKFSVMPVNEGNLKALESMGQRWTVKPSQELHIDYQQGDDVGGYVVYPRCASVLVRLSRTAACQTQGQVGAERFSLSSGRPYGGAWASWRVASLPPCHDAPKRSVRLAGDPPGTALRPRKTFAKQTLRS